ncbi:hypothetical protein G3N55_10745 [Dissulfurirhabdus thermomarina]|uniref:Lipoprotein n=1 Tax=Dissulfurirhabdus thermomarina TaxID=1765737 RepID=A0A6N9TXV9_DISTH|nr:hypothetical protein [Dissulfurirhabdus thermomarina]NDY43316.1 hypothetical protein [Dissulfurirhabdus thermomarina]NMX23478.1 hypothetical protein [Dissulfurirhabdus thermomarina]
MKHNLKVLLLMFMATFIVGCAISEDGTLRDSKGVIVSSSKEEISQTQRTLLNEEIPNNLPASAEGGVIFDGKVISVDINPSGLYTTLFEVDRVLFGDLKGEKKVVVRSPSPNKTGIDFKKGETYRVFAVYLDGSYRTWDWLGSVKIDNGNLAK